MRGYSLTQSTDGNPLPIRYSVERGGVERAGEGEGGANSSRFLLNRRLSTAARRNRPLSPLHTTTPQGPRWNDVSSGFGNESCQVRLGGTPSPN
jgi:hypothetical protein